jgi:hypothetical protein
MLVEVKKMDFSQKKKKNTNSSETKYFGSNMNNQANKIIQHVAQNVK